jgi:hypothetical protein
MRLLNEMTINSSSQRTPEMRKRSENGETTARWQVSFPHYNTEAKMYDGEKVRVLVEDRKTGTSHNGSLHPFTPAPLSHRNGGAFPSTRITGGQCSAIAAEPETNSPLHTDAETTERFPPRAATRFTPSLQPSDRRAPATFSRASQLKAFHPRITLQ